MTRFISDAKDLETVEYAIIAGLMVAAVVVSIGSVGAWVKGVYKGLQTEMGA